LAEIVRHIEPAQSICFGAPAAHSIPPIPGCALCEGFERGIPGEQLAQSAELSMSRVYQIRDGRRYPTECAYGSAR
jgi:hypothetical protein